MLTDESWIQILHCTVQAKQRLLPFWMGCGSWVELMLRQTPVYMTHPPRALQFEDFPAPVKNLRRPKFSIVTPSYQQARFLEQTMRSVLEQRDVDCQYVVQDGGSTDGSQQLLAAVAEGRRETAPLFAAANPVGPVGASSRPEDRPLACAGAIVPGSRQGVTKAKEPGVRLVAWESVPDAGQADAIVKGFAKTAGEPDDLMAWINSDDFYLPGALAFVADHFTRHPEVDVLYGHRIVVDEKSQEIARWFLPRHDDEVLRLNDFVPQETLFWRRRVWDKVSGLDASFKFAMDWDLLLRFQAAGARIVRVPYFLACFRVHPAQKTSAAMHGIGQQEITLLRERTHGRSFPPQALENNPQIIRYLRRSALVEFMWKLGVRLP